MKMRSLRDETPLVRELIMTTMYGGGPRVFVNKAKEHNATMQEFADALGKVREWWKSVSLIDTPIPKGNKNDRRGSPSW